MEIRRLKLDRNRIKTIVGLEQGRFRSIVMKMNHDQPTLPSKESAAGLGNSVSRGGGAGVGLA